MKHKKMHKCVGIQNVNSLRKKTTYVFYVGIMENSPIFLMSKLKLVLKTIKEGLLMTLAQ